MTVASVFVRAARLSKRRFPWLTPEPTHPQVTSEPLRQSLRFAALDVDPSEVVALARVAFLLTTLAVVVCGCCILFVLSILGSVDLIVALLFCVLTIALPSGAMAACLAYPAMHAKYVRIQTLGDVPEILCYLVMYLKLVPNLENSVTFAATESKTALARDLCKVLWDMEIRLHHGIDDALDAFASTWGAWHEYFRRSLHLLKASVCERDEASRTLTLDRALDVSLDGTKEMMNEFVNALHQPTMVLYSVGIMIPLALVAMLPATGLVGLHLSLVHVFLLYDVCIPLAVGAYMWKILLSRPAAFAAPHIPPDHPRVKAVDKRREATIALMLGGIISAPVLCPMLPSFLVPTDVDHIRIQVQGVLPLTLFPVWGVATALAWYCLRVYTPYKRVRDEIKAMEREFSDALFVLGKRLAEDKSPEESFQFTGQAMKGAAIAEVFGHATYLLHTQHITLRDAFFHPEFGALRFVASDRIKALTRLVVEGMQKSQQAVSLSVIRIADHLKQLQDVEAKIVDMLCELTSTLKATTAVFAPLIAGVTLSITSLVASILSSVQSEMAAIPEDVAAQGLVSSFAVQNIDPSAFVLVIGIYLLELVVLLTRFTNGIHEGDDTPQFMYSLGRTVVVSVAVFSLTTVLGQHFLAQLVPT